MDKVQEMLDIILKACDDKNSIDTKVLDISEMTSIADYFVIASGNSSSQVSAITDEIERKMSESGFELNNNDGQNSARWIILDYADIIVHVFHKEEREYYDLERLWERVNSNNIEEDVQ